jgi:hypothetical protein
MAGEAGASTPQRRAGNTSTAWLGRASPRLAAIAQCAGPRGGVQCWACVTPVEPGVVPSGAGCRRSAVSEELLRLELLLAQARSMEGGFGCTERAPEVYAGPRAIDLLIDPVSV